MNDQLSGQLCSGWTLPAYARESLFLETAHETVNVEGAKGLFTLNMPTELLTLRWGGMEGPALARLRWRVDSLEWDGSIRIGGLLDALHIGELPGLEAPVVVLHLGGQPLKPSVSPYPMAATRASVPYPIPDPFTDVDDELDDTETTWMALDDSPQLVLAQDALVSKLHVACYGRLAEQGWGWHEAFALPIALEAMTLYAP